MSSASIIMAFIISSERKHYEEVLRELVALRPIVDPNRGFVNQLREFDELLQHKQL